MKKSFKLLLCFTLILGLMLSVFSFGASAAQALLSFNKSGYVLGETVRVTIKYNATVPIYANEVDITYNNAVLKVTSVNGGEYSLGTNSVKIVDDDLSTATTVHTSGTYTVTFSTVAVGDANVSVNVISDGGSAAASGTAKVTLSGNANLGSLSVSGGVLAPAFNPNVTSYTATVKYGVDKATLSAGVADGNSTVVGAGTFDLIVGDNIKTITVSAANGTKKSYTVNIKRLTEEETLLWEQQERENDPLLVVFNDKDYHLVADIAALPIPGGYTASTATYKENVINTFTDSAGEYTLAYLTADDDAEKTPILFYLDSNGEFKELPHIVSGGNLYVIEAPSVDFEVGKEYYMSSILLGTQSVATYGFTDERLKDFHIVYAYYNGERGFYRYDTVGNTIQRAPDFSVSTESDSQQVNILANFADLKTNAKIVIILIGISIVCVIALIVLFIFKVLYYRNQIKDDDDEGIAFDDIKEIDGFNNTEAEFKEENNEDNF